MQLNELKPNKGSNKVAKRRGRGIGSGLGKTGGRGHKGQKSRSGGFHKLGFEGGQMPIQRRLPKFGFKSRKGDDLCVLRLDALDLVEADLIDIEVLKEAGLVKKSMKQVKVILAGEVKHKKTVKGIRLTKGAKKAIEDAGGKVEE